MEETVRYDRLLNLFQSLTLRRLTHPTILATPQATGKMPVPHYNFSYATGKMPVPHYNFSYATGHRQDACATLQFYLRHRPQARCLCHITILATPQATGKMPVPHYNFSYATGHRQDACSTTLHY